MVEPHQVEGALELQLAQHLLGCEVLDADDNVAGKLAELGRQALPRPAAASSSNSASPGARLRLHSLPPAMGEPLPLPTRSKR